MSILRVPEVLLTIPYRMLGWVVILASLCTLPVAAGTTERVSVASDGSEGDDGSTFATMSPDGRYVAFRSLASNLVAGDTNAACDIFVHDRETGATERVSVASDGTEGNGDCWFFPSFSADGRYVSFESEASNLVPDDTNGVVDVFVHDRQTGFTERVSIASDGAQALLSGGMATVIGGPSLSADGRYVAFHSQAWNLVSGDANDAFDIFVHDRQTGVTERVSIVSDGAEGNSHSYSPSISADGRYVAFQSEASDLVPDDTNAAFDVFVHDRQTGATERMSLAGDGAQGNQHSFFPSISADGRYLTFQSDATNLVAYDTNGVGDVFVRDRDTGEIERVSLGSDGTQGNQDSGGASISGSGRYVAFESAASGLVPGDGNDARDVFVRDRDTGTTELLSVADDGAQGGGDSGLSSMSADGRHVSFYSAASDLVADDTNDAIDVFVRDRRDLTLQFSGSPTSGAAPLMVDFINLSTGGPASWLWDFGDGQTATGPDTSHEYTSPGKYTVSLTTTDTWGPATETQADYIVVTFPDLPLDHWALDEVLACVRAGLVSGYDDGLYQSDWPVDRSQMAVFISRALAGGDENVPDPTQDPGFTDVISEHWAYKYIVYAVDQNVVEGYPEGDYKPDLVVTRDQMAVYVARSICDPTGEDGLVGYLPADPRNFPDVPPEFWAQTHIEYCVEHGIVQGYPYPQEDDSVLYLYQPDDVVTRDQMAVYVARAFGLASAAGVSAAGSPCGSCD